MQIYRAFLYSHRGVGAVDLLLTEQPDPSLLPRHIVRINQVVDLIDQRYDQPWTLNQLATTACYSPYHFHRLFFAVTGQTPQDYIRRQRLARVAGRLLHEDSLPIAMLAMDGGFNSPANFSRAFQWAFGMSPRQWRSEGAQQIMEVRKTETRQLLGRLQHQLKPQPKLIVSSGRIETEVLPPVRVAYIRSRGLANWALSLGWTQLQDWYRQQPYAGSEAEWIGAFHSTSGLCGLPYQHYDRCVVIPETAPVDPAMSTRVLPGGRFAMLPFSGNPAMAMEYYLQHWLPDSGWVLEDREYRDCLSSRGMITRTYGYLAVPVRRNKANI
ncbi:AraC family transcriptional regulator [Chitinilyticum aquatile]|uniref:AraC family transcriptional regulator n=1 Tax=Chitinilyticum aquatile TaxID=362520 RepID=UPI00138B1483|nr:AraC family transcriptional regulator [Chitinilyticum aquatile]